MCHISGAIYHTIMIFGTIVLNDDISRHFFHFFGRFHFLDCSGVKGLKITQNEK